MRIFVFLLLNVIFFSLSFSNTLQDNNNNINIEFILDKVKNSNPELKMKKIETDILNIESKKKYKEFVLPSVIIQDDQKFETYEKDGIDFNELEATMNVFEGGKSYYSYKKANVDYKASEKDEFLTLLEYQEKAIDEYFNVLNFRKQQEITTLVIEALNNQNNKLKQLYQGEQQVSLSEIYKIEADIEMNIAINIKSNQYEESSKEKLYQILGMNLNSQNEFLEFSIENYLYDKLSLAEDEKKLLKNSSYIQYEKMKLDSAYYDIKIAQGDLYPSIQAGVTKTFYESNYKDDDEKGTVVRVGFIWLFQWGRALDTINQKEEEYRKTKIAYDNYIKNLTREFRNQYRTIESLYGQLNAQSKRVALLDKNLKLDTLRYDSQLISTFDYLNSVNELKKSQEYYYKLQRDLVLATIRYENLAR